MSTPRGITSRDIAEVKAVVSVFETGRPLGDPAAIAVLDDGAGFSCGVHQATHGSGSLFKVVKAYVEAVQAAGAPFTPGTAAYHLSAYLKILADRSPASRQQLVRRHGADFRKWWKVAAVDPLMRRAQEEVFDVNYMKPAIAAARARGWQTPLGLCVAYDSHIQGSWGKCIRQVPDNLTEQQEVLRYLDVRERFLLSLPRSSQKASVYRPRELREEARRGNWGLDVPMTIHGRRIDDAIIAALEAANVNVREERAAALSVAADPEVDVQTHAGDFDEPDVRPTPSLVDADGVTDPVPDRPTQFELSDDDVSPRPPADPQAADTGPSPQQPAAEPATPQPGAPDAPAAPSVQVEHADKVVAAPPVVPGGGQNDPVKVIRTQLPDLLQQAGPYLKSGLGTSGKWSIGAVLLSVVGGVWKAATSPFGLVILGIGAVIFIVWQVSRYLTNKENMRLEDAKLQRAHEMAKLTLQVALTNQQVLADGSKQNVIVSTGNEEIEVRALQA